MKIYDLECTHRQREGSALNISKIGNRIATVYRVGFERVSRVFNRTARENIVVDKFRRPQYTAARAGSLSFLREKEGNPVQIRGCPAAVSENESTTGTGSFGLGSSG